MGSYSVFFVFFLVLGSSLVREIIFIDLFFKNPEESRVFWNRLGGFRSGFFFAYLFGGGELGRIFLALFGAVG